MLRRVWLLLIVAALVASSCAGSDRPTLVEAPDVTLEPIAAPTSTPRPTPDPGGAPSRPASAQGATPTAPPEEVVADDDAETSAVDRSVSWQHIEGFDLPFVNGRADMAVAEQLFDDLGGGGSDIVASVTNLLASIDHPLEFEEIAQPVRDVLVDGEAEGVFTLLAVRYGVIGCEAHLAGSSKPDWNRHLFDHLLGRAEGLSAEAAENQAGQIAVGAEVATLQMCPQLQGHN